MKMEEDILEIVRHDTLLFAVVLYGCDVIGVKWPVALHHHSLCWYLSWLHLHVH
jgi:hypothetical protein